MELEDYIDLSSRASPSEMVTPIDPSTPELIPGATKNLFSPNYILRTQSSRLHDDSATLLIDELDLHLQSDVRGRIMQVGETLAAHLFPDEDFGFAINDGFVNKFCGSFISKSMLFDPHKFENEATTATFLNRIITTIAKYLASTGTTPLKPLRYFTSIHASKSMKGSPTRVKPDIMIVPLIDGCIRQGNLSWTDAQSIIEHTLEVKPPSRMGQTVRIKSFMAFCHQPERDFLPFICITRNHFHIIVTDHTGLIETQAIPFDRTSSTLIFFRMVMGLTFLPVSNLGLDPTIIRRDRGEKSAQSMSDAYLPFGSDILEPKISRFFPDSPTTSSTTPISPTTGTPEPDFDDDVADGFVTISINNETYKVVRLLFRSQTLIGRATKAFLVKLSNGSLGVLKDSWISAGRTSEANFLKDLYIPFGPQLLNHCVLRDTSTFRQNPVNSLEFCRREKRRILTYPAGIHISNFFCLWELMVALLDIVVCMNLFYISFDNFSDFDTHSSYTVPRIPPNDSPRYLIYEYPAQGPRGGI